MENKSQQGEMPETHEGEMPETPASESNQELTPEQLKAQLADYQKRVKELNRESAERRKKIEEFEIAEAERKQAAMTESEKALAKIKQLEDEKIRLENEKNALEAQVNFDRYASEAGAEFVNERARQDAFILLEKGEDIAVSFKKLLADRPYLFKKQATLEIPDAAARGRATATMTTEQAIAAKRRLVSPI